MDSRGEYFYLGSDSKFRGLNVSLNRTGSGVSADALKWDYWNGTVWVPAGFTMDETESLTKGGAIYWDTEPSDWKVYSLDGGPELYYVRAHLAFGESYGTSPLERLIKTDIILFQYCGDIIDDNQTFELDLGTPTAVELLSLTATGLDGEVLLEWETATEVDNLGFYLYRAESEEGPYERVNEVAVPGLGFLAYRCPLPLRGFRSYEWHDLLLRARGFRSEWETDPSRSGVGHANGGSSF